MSRTRAKSRLLFYVQHLLGIGHLRRAALLSDALVACGFDVHMVLGGESVASIHFVGASCHYLPAIRVRDADFSTLVDASGEPLSEQARTRRRNLLLALAEQIRPDAIITELYPFGRRQMRFELRPLLDWASRQHPRPITVSSLRDILQQRSEQRELETLELIEHYYDRVWVHGDEQVTSLQSTFRPAERLGSRLHYTGYVAPTAPRARHRRGILVSAGGGAVGQALLRAALVAQRSGLFGDRPWTLVSGPNLPQPVFDELQLEASAQGVELYRFCHDFIDRLAGAELSVSQAGYNTVMDLLVSEVPAVLVPFVGDGETEQTTRARQLEAAGRVALVDEAQLSGATLARAMQQALSLSTAPPRLQLDGARRAAADLQQLLERRAEVMA